MRAEMFIFWFTAISPSSVLRAWHMEHSINPYKRTEWMTAVGLYVGEHPTAHQGSRNWLALSQASPHRQQVCERILGSASVNIQLTFWIPSGMLQGSVQFSLLVVSNSLWPHESQHARPPCPSPTPGVYSNSRPSSRWFHPAISSCHPLLLLLPIPPSIRVFSNESTLRMRWPNYWISISPSNEQPGLISFRMDWLDLLAVQGTLKSLLQHHSSKASILQRSDFFTVRLSHPYMTTGKTIALTRWTFVGKVISLLFNMLSRLVITFLPRSKHLLISWLQSPSAVILEPPKIKSDTVSTVSPSISHAVMGPDAMLFVFWMLRFKPTFSLSTFTFIKRLFSSSSLSAIRVASAYLRLLIFLLAILIPACASSSPAFLMMYSA